MPRARASQIVRAPFRFWWGSLPLRVVGSTLVSSLLVTVLGGFLLMQQATTGLVQGKMAAAMAESSVALDNVEQGIRTGSLGPSTGTEMLTRAATEAVKRGAVGGQYAVVLQGPVSDIMTPGLDQTSVPSDLRLAVAGGTDGLWVKPTLVRYTTGASEPGVVVGASVAASGSLRYPIFFVFPMTQETSTLLILQQALLTTGAVLTLLLALISYAVSRQVVRPVRAARLAAERLASGQLDDRMPIRGTDDLARLAVSMNYMATQLQQRIRQLEELSRVQQRFVSDVSHELRTPLTTVRLAADVLYDARTEFPAMEERSAVLMHRELDRFEELLADLLEISRFDAGAAVLALDETDLAELVASEVQSLRPLADTRSTELRLHVGGSCTAEIDSRRVSRVLRNLITNAIEHGEGRPIDISVACDDDAAAITVRDHGVGFRASESQQVFHRFWRSDPARSRQVGGTGLGLAIALEDVRLHNGWLNAWARPRRGAHFRVTLPRRYGDELRGSPLPVVPDDVVPHQRPLVELGAPHGDQIGSAP